MADYYPILAHAVSRLATNNAEARQELYDHARTILTKHLHEIDPHRSALDPVGEPVALEMAILSLETKLRSVGEIRPGPFSDCSPLPGSELKIEDFLAALRELDAGKERTPASAASESTVDRLRELEASRRIGKHLFHPAREQ